MTQFSLQLCPRHQESHTNCHPSPNQALTPQEDTAALTSNCTTKDANTQSPRPRRVSPSGLGHCGLGRGVGCPLPPAGMAPACGPFLCVKGSPGPWQMSSGSGCIEIALPQSGAAGSLVNASFCVAANCFQFHKSRSLSLPEVQTLWPWRTSFHLLSLLPSQAPSPRRLSHKGRWNGTSAHEARTPVQWAHSPGA